MLGCWPYRSRISISSEGSLLLLSMIWDRPRRREALGQTVPEARTFPPPAPRDQAAREASLLRPGTPENSQNTWEFSAPPPHSEDMGCGHRLSGKFWAQEGKELPVSLDQLVATHPDTSGDHGPR